MRVEKSPSEKFSTENYVKIFPGQLGSNVHYILVNGQFVFNARHDISVPRNVLVTTAVQRRWTGLSLNENASVEAFQPTAEISDLHLSAITLQVSFASKSSQAVNDFDTENMGEIFTKLFHNHIFSTGQIMEFIYCEVKLKCKVVELEMVKEMMLRGPHSEKDDVDGSKAERGILIRQTAIQFAKSSESTIRLTGANKKMRKKPLIKADFKFEDLGIGGLDKEFSDIFRRAFASRTYSPSFVKKLGVKHVKGILLYGPPGTGKTLIARQIGKMLNAQEPKVVSGPEVLSKYVGQSEENVRKLFEDAEAEYKAKGDESSLHTIILDELDAICKQRGSRGGESAGVGDSVVNQLLAKMDGVGELNNILIIGMTNRKDMIDEALTRPGRLEVHMEIGLPDEDGRLQILDIHTSQMRSNNILGTDVSLEDLADMTKNYSGAEIAGLVKAASSYAFARHGKIGISADVVTKEENMKVKMEDFIKALKDVPASFGISETELRNCVQNDIIPFGPHIEQILADGKLFVEQVRLSEKTPLVSVLYYGPTSSGKTALAATIALESEFPFIKLISPETMVGLNESAKIAAIHKVFNDAYRSPFSVIVVDDLERLIDYAPVGPRFSNGLLQTILVLIKKKPPKGRRMLILGTTTEHRALDDLDLSDKFDSEILVPNISSLEALEIVVHKLDLFSASEQKRAMSMLKEANFDKTLDIGISRLMMVAEMARQDADKVDKFVKTLLEMPVSTKRTVDGATNNWAPCR
ncbi:P-loop containing nucleoside triphosphate hydrolase protein [Dichotomocladium elegans]|nr:P-loop containing nucleoside triphosphate hydrolase protein [Dichotomocladium elegans]